MSESLQRINKDFILVEFQEKAPLKVGSLELIIPERFLVQDDDGDGKGSAWAVTTDRRTINPQVCKVITGNDTIPAGKLVFVHYGAFEVAQWLNPKRAFIKSAMVFFFVDPIKPLNGMYLGEEVWVEGEKTESGIFTTPYAEKKEGIKIKLTHVPDDGVFNVGDTVITIDVSQYTLNFEGKNYVKLKESEIIGLCVKDEVYPIGKTMVVKYLPDEDIEQRIAENQKRSDLRDFAIRNMLHVPNIDFEPVKEPKTAKATILSCGTNVRNALWADGDTILVLRNFGAILPNGNWIINFETVLGRFYEA